MDIPNLYHCLILTRTTLPLSFSLPFLIHRPPFHPLSLLSSSLSSFLSLLLPFSLSFPLSSSLLSSSFLPLYLPLFLFLPPSVLPLPLYSLIPLFRLTSLRHAICILNPTLHDISSSSIFLELPLYSSLSLLSSFSPSLLLCVFLLHIITAYGNFTTIACCYSNISLRPKIKHTKNNCGKLLCSIVYNLKAYLKQGASIKYVTLFWTNFYPTPPRVTLCHTSRDPPKYVTHLGPPNF